MRPPIGGAARAQLVRGRRIAVASATFVFLVAAPAARADCPITDLTCTTDTVTDTADDVVDEVVDTGTDTVEAVTEETASVTDPIVDTAEGAVETVDDTVGTVEEIVDDTTGTVEEIVDDTTGTVEEIVDDTLGIVTEAADDAIAPTLNEPTSSAESPGTGTGGVRPGGSGPDPTSELPPRPSVTLGVPDSTLEAETIAAFDAAARSLLDDVGSGFLDLAKTVAFPMALALVVAAFLMVQNRLDRRDPKLALAPIGPDLLGFS